MKEFEFKELKKATQDFCPSNIIGKGSHGCVYKGVLPNGHIVAIKKSSIALHNLQDNSKLQNEISILSSLPKLSNSVSLLGTSCLDSSVTNSALLVMEFMPNGSLHDSLHNTTSSILIMSWSRRVKIAIQLAKSLQLLHNLNPKVVHRDVKSANILFDRDWNVKLGDFGLALRLNIGQRKQVDSVSRPAGTIGYLDPCYTTPCMLSTKIDVFSFGVVLFELISGQKVIDSSRSQTCIVDWALPLVKSQKLELIFDQRVTMPTFMGRVVKKLLGLAGRCVGENHNRPTMDEIVYEIENRYVERIRFGIWVKFMIILKKEQKVAKRKQYWRERVVQHNTRNTNTSLGKLLLRDVLANAID